MPHSTPLRITVRSRWGPSLVMAIITTRHRSTNGTSVMAVIAYVANTAEVRMIGTASSAGPGSNRRRKSTNASAPVSPPASRDIHLPVVKWSPVSGEARTSSAG